MDSKGKKIPELHELYLKSLDDKELKAYYIAKSHLGTTYNLEKSNGFAEWQKKNVS